MVLKLLLVPVPKNWNNTTSGIYMSWSQFAGLHCAYRSMKHDISFVVIFKIYGL